MSYTMFHWSVSAREFCDYLDVDLNTKALPTRQFRYLRDNMNGYGLVMLYYPDVPMPTAAISRDELIEMIQEYDNAEAERAKKKTKASKL